MVALGSGSPLANRYNDGDEGCGRSLFSLHPYLCHLLYFHLMYVLSVCDGQ